LKIEKKKWRNEKWRNVFTRNDVDLKFFATREDSCGSGGYEYLRFCLPGRFPMLIHPAE
jgi:hypothetical protein